MPNTKSTLPQQRGQMFIADGGVETHIIFNKGHDFAHQTIFQLLAREVGWDVMRAYYRDYLPIARASGQGFLVETPTWRASPDWGALVGYDGPRLRAINIAATELCAQIAWDFRAQGTPTVISGAIGPRRDAWQFDSAMSVNESMAYHALQVEAFAHSKADFVAGMTLTNTPEAIGIALLAKESGIPCVISFTLETDGNLPGGKSLAEAITEVDQATDACPAYFMVNCTHPIHFAETVRRGGAWRERIGGLRMNASSKSHAELDESDTLDIGDWNDLGQHYKSLLPHLPNVRVLGGCCGTDHRHIGAICQHCLPQAAA